MSSSVKRNEIVHKVETLQVQSTFSHYCDIRNDVWGGVWRLATCQFLDRQFLDRHSNPNPNPNPVQDLTVQELTVQELT